MFLFFLLCPSFFLFSQVLISIEDDQDNIKGVLEVRSQMKNGKGGIVLPKVEDISKVKDPKGNNPVVGTLVYDESRECLVFYRFNIERKEFEWSPCINTFSYERRKGF